MLNQVSHTLLGIRFLDIESNKVSITFEPGQNFSYVGFDIIDNAIVEENRIVQLLLVVSNSNTRTALTIIHIIDDDGER